MAQHHRLSGGIDAEVVRVWLLGGFRVSVGSRTIEGNSWRLKKAASLVKLLALAPGHRLHRARITAALWPDLDEQSASNNLHRTLHFARAALEPDVKSATSRYLPLYGDMLELCPDGELWVDVEAFEDATATARRTGEPAAYRAAVELYVGDLLPEDLYEPWTEEKREGLRRLHLALLVELAALHEEREEYEPAVGVLKNAVAEEPTQEEAQAALMRLYALGGHQHEAIVQYERLRKALHEELDTEPAAATRRLYEEIRTGNFPAAPSPPSAGDRLSEELSDSSPNNLPTSLTSFVGRADALLEVKRLLSMTRLLTLTGAGGTGKTRLALEVAHGLVGTYPDGAWLVELAPLSDPELVPQAVAQALGVREVPGRSLTQTLSAHLKPRQTLLVLDNCEHVVDAAARLAESLLRACPKLRILATSREPLGVPGEALFTVPPLSLPEEGVPTAEGLMRCEAVRLFVERARSRLPGFELTRENAGSVTRVCRKLEGIPLAIELAAARMGALAIEQVAQRLEDSLKILGGGVRTVDPRHQTMRAALAWSHELLSEPERRLFRRLSVFAGGWTLEAAEEVCSGEGIEEDEVLDLLGRLVDKSLVVSDTGRYRMLEPVRQYGREKLEDAGETPSVPPEEAERVREHHARYYLAFAEEGGAREPGLALKESRPLEWYERMETEHGNLRAALSWALDREEAGDHEEELGLRLAVAMRWFWYTHGNQSEGQRYLEKALSARRGSNNPATTGLRARAWIGAGWMALIRADYGEAKALMEEGLALCRELGDKEGIASALTELGWVAVLGQRDDIPIAAVMEELMELKPHLENRITLSYLLLLEGAIVAIRGDLERSARLHEEALALYREMRDAPGIVTCLTHFGLVELLRADYEGAASLLREALGGGRVLDMKPGIQVCLHGLACVAAHRHQPARATRLWGAVEGIQKIYGVHISSITRSVTDYEGLLATVRSQLGEEEAFAAAWAEGETMSLERAIEYALYTEEPSPPATSRKPQRTHTDEPADPLTSRQREVALLIRQGLTNAQIADALAVSKNTVANHVARILHKLGLPSRSRIATWATERKLRDPE